MKKRDGSKVRANAASATAGARPDKGERAAGVRPDQGERAAAEAAAPTPTPTSTASPGSAPSGNASGMGAAVLVALGLAGVIFFLNRGASGGDGIAAEAGDPIDLGDHVAPADPAGAEREDDADRAVEAGAPVVRPERLTVRVVGSYPHDPRAFTQGLEYHDGVLFEGTGIRRRSTIRRVALDTGEVLASVELPPDVFGEGISVVGERIFQLSWVEGRAFVRSRSDLSVEREFTYEGEGWGLCHDGARLVMSDGSDHLFFRDTETFAVTGSVAVTLAGEPLDMLNELECVEGLVYANVWQTDHIARIDPNTGVVTGWIDTVLHAGNDPGQGLLEPGDTENADVLNGIAWMPDRQHFLIGGKEWPRLFEVEFVPAAPAAE